MIGEWKLQILSKKPRPVALIQCKTRRLFGSGILVLKYKLVKTLCECQLKNSCKEMLLYQPTLCNTN